MKIFVYSRHATLGVRLKMSKKDIAKGVAEVVVALVAVIQGYYRYI